MKNFLYFSEFISEEEERQLIDNLLHDSHPWSKINGRRIKHYGLTYDYPTFSCVHNDTPPIPPYADWLMDRLYAKLESINWGICSSSSHDDDDDASNNDYPFPTLPPNEYRSEYFNQFTVQEYLPKTGIAPHVDIVDYFEEFIVLVSLGSHVTMHFYPSEWPPASPVPGSIAKRRHRFSNISTTDNSANKEISENINIIEQQKKKKLISLGSGTGPDPYPKFSGVKDCVLERRSVAVLFGDSRYVYKHGIRERRTDCVNGQIMERSTRYSITLRRAYKSHPSSQIREPCIVYNSQRPYQLETINFR